METRCVACKKSDPKSRNRIRANVSLWDHSRNWDRSQRADHPHLTTTSTPKSAAALLFYRPRGCVKSFARLTTDAASTKRDFRFGSASIIEPFRNALHMDRVSGFIVPPIAEEF